MWHVLYVMSLSWETRGSRDQTTWPGPPVNVMTSDTNHFLMMGPLPCIKHVLSGPWAIRWHISRLILNVSLYQSIWLTQRVVIYKWTDMHNIYPFRYYVDISSLELYPSNRQIQSYSLRIIPSICTPGYTSWINSSLK